MDATQIVLTVISSLLAPIIALIVWLAKSKHTQKKDYQKEMKEMEKRDKELKELCNYIAGATDILNQETIKVTPEIRKTFKEFSKRYHSLDLVPLPKEDK